MSASIASCSPPTSRISKTNGPIPGRSSTRSTPTSRQRINARSGSATPSNSSSSVIDRAPPHPDPLPASGAREKAPRPALAGRGRDPRQREDEGSERTGSIGGSLIKVITLQKEILSERERERTARSSIERPSEPSSSARDE